MLVTLFGISIDVKLLQYSKAVFPIASFLEIFSSSIDLLEYNAITTVAIAIAKLEIIENKMPDITIQREVFNWDQDYYPKEYSEFFYDYFKTEKKENELFIYENNALRNEIHKNIMAKDDNYDLIIELSKVE